MWAEPDLSFAAMDRALERNTFVDRHGVSTCCMSALWEDYSTTKTTGAREGRRLLLGSSHRKARRQPEAGQYNCVGRAYAFDRSPAARCSGLERVLLPEIRDGRRRAAERQTSRPGGSRANIEMREDPNCLSHLPSACRIPPSQ